MSLLIGSVAELKLDSTRVSDFYSKNWERRIALINERFYNWQFKSLPLTNGIDNCVVAYDSDKDVIAGVMGLNARPFYLNEQRLNGAELTTWVVAEDYRSTGAGAKILSRIQASYDVLIGMGISDMALPVYLRSGFRYLAAIPRFVRVYEFDALASVAIFDPLAKKLASKWLGRVEEVKYSSTEGMDDEANALFNRCASSYNFYSRDGKHLKWRYIDHPLFQYRIFFVRPSIGGGLAFVALRKETVVPGLNIFHVTDCIGDDSAMSSAFSFIDDFCRQESAHVVDFYCTATKINKYPLSRGWFSVADDAALKFPHLFHPIEIRNPATTSLIYWSKDNFTEMCDFSKLYITKEDADFDRPVLQTE